MKRTRQEGKKKKRWQKQDRHDKASEKSGQTASKKEGTRKKTRSKAQDIEIRRNNSKQSEIEQRNKSNKQP